MKCKQFSVIDKESWKMKHIFERVSSADVICPIFVVDQPGDEEVEIEMMYSYDFQQCPFDNAVV